MVSSRLTINHMVTPFRRRKNTFQKHIQTCYCNAFASSVNLSRVRFHEFPLVACTSIHVIVEMRQLIFLRSLKDNSRSLTNGLEGQ
ncbi:hypothetical protein KCU65_g136, partial [Aureobasidium melanogenum]